MAGLTYVNRWAEIAAKVKPAVQKGLKATGTVLQSNIRSGAAVRTGFMRDNVYMSAWDGSDYGAGSPPGDSYRLPQVTPGDDTTVIVGAAANYSVFVELGHHTRGGGSWVPAQPFFIPGVEATRGTFLALMQAALDEGLV